MMKKINVLTIGLLLSMMLMSCNNSEMKNNSVSNVENKKAEDSYIEDVYGFADNHIEGEYIALITRKGNGCKVEESTKFSEDSKDGAVFYKALNRNNNLKEIICVYLTDEEDSRIFLKCEDLKEDEMGSRNSYTIGLAQPHMKSRCYCAVKEHYLIVTELAEISEGWYDGYYYLAYDNSDINSDNLFYEEKITVYDLNDNFEEKLEITRKIVPKNNLKEFEISKSNDKIVYASGYKSYSCNSAEMISTEQEFCDRANSFLDDFSIDWIRLARTSWENRWYRLEIDESSIPTDMVKVDFKCSNGKINADGNVISDIAITVNADKEEHGELEEEGADEPITYKAKNANGEGGNTSVGTKKDWNFNGTWVSEDGKYVFTFKEQSGSIGIDYNSGISAADGTFSYVDIDNGNERIQGSFIFSGENTVITTANLSNGENVTFSFEDNKLVSDELTLNKIPDEMITQFKGTWKNSDEEIIFEDDGIFNYTREDESIWGYYYVLSETTILLSNKSNDFKVSSYSIIGTQMKLNEEKVYQRIGDGADAASLLKLKDIIIGTWKTTILEGEEYRFNIDGTWERYHVFYNDEQTELIFENLIESGTYKILNDNELRLEKQGGIQFNQLAYDESTGVISGDGIYLEKTQ